MNIAWDHCTRNFKVLVHKKVIVHTLLVLLVIPLLIHISSPWLELRITRGLDLSQYLRFWIQGCILVGKSSIFLIVLPTLSIITKILQMGEEWLTWCGSLRCMVWTSWWLYEQKRLACPQLGRSFQCLVDLCSWIW
jgi:hypothetical protein